MSTKNKWSQPPAPPPPLFFGKKERDLVKQVNDELIERVVGQTIVYYPIDLEVTNFHSLYGEAIEKTFLPPVRVHALVKFDSHETTTTNYGLERLQSVSAYFHKRRITEDQDLFVREGDFILHGKLFYEIVTTAQPRRLFGQDDYQVEISATCIEARSGVFNGQ